MTDAHALLALLALRILVGAIVLLLFCGLCILIPELRSQWILWRERVAIAKRDAAKAKADAKRLADAQRWGLIPFPKKMRRVSCKALDFAYRTGSFSVGRSVYSDVLGVHK